MYIFQKFNQMCLTILNIKCLRFKFKGYRGVQPPKMDFVHFHIYCSPIFLLSKMESYVSQFIETFCFTSAYVKSVLQNIGKIALGRKMVIFSINWRTQRKLQVNYKFKFLPFWQRLWTYTPEKLRKIKISKITAQCFVSP